MRVSFTDDAGNEESLTSASTSAVTQVAALSTDATLRALTLSGIDFGTFESATTSYTARVNNTVTETTVAPTLNHSGASYVIKPGGVTDADGVISLSEGSNVITVDVTAEDGQTTSTYTVTVTRLDSQSSPISSDATLSGLTLSGINFGTFASGTTSYSITVANSVSQTAVTPTVNHSEASHVIKLGGVTDADGTVSLAVGNNVITVEVTAEDGSTTQTYTVTVTRADPPSTDATLRALTVDGRNIGRGSMGPLYWVAYHLIDVDYSVTEATVTPTVNHSGASYVIKLNGVEDADGTVSLAVGDNRITVEVTAEDGETTLTYRVSFKRRALTVSGITSSDYAENGTESVATYAVAGAGTSTITWSLSGDDSGDFSISSAGVLSFSTSPDYESPVDADTDNVYQVTIQASDGTNTATLDVTVTVTRLVSLQQNSTDATLSGLSLSGVNFGTFASGTNSYSAQVANSVQQTTVTSTVNHSGASYVIKLGGVEDADGTVSLTVGSNTITIEVTAEDDSTTKSYTVTVTRVPNTPATGAPTISSTAEVGQTLTARTSGISDDDGLDNATYAYQWIRTEGTTDTDIAGATETTYLVTTDDVDRALGVRISFTDDAGNQESLTSAATAEVETPLTAELQNVPEIHNGEDAFTFRVLFSEPVTADHQALKEDSFDISNGTIKRARQVNGRNDLRQFTVQPSSNNDVVMVLPADRSCDAEGAICTSDGKRLSNRLELTVPGLVPANSPAVGLPTISGMAQVGDALMADTSRIADADGLINVTYSYQWVANDGTTDTDIQDATGFTFTPVDAYEGKTIKVRVSFTDDAGNGESLTSAATVSVAARPNTPTPDAPDQPIATAVFVAGVDLEWNDVPGADSYDVQLYRNGQWIDLPGEGVEIAFYGAGAIISGLDPDSTLWFQVRAKNAHGSSDWSNFSSVASTNQFKLGRRARPDNVPASGAPVINGTAQVGESLTADTTGIADGNGLDRVQFRFQWVSSDGTTDTDIQSATESTYTLKTADTDRTVSARVAFTDRGGYAESLTGTATEQVAPSAHANPAPTPEPAQNSPATGSPAVTGTAQVGETLSADISRIGDADGLANVSYSYQWVRNDGTSDTDITDAAESSYTLVAADDGKTIKVRVSFTDDEANEETLISTATEAVSFAVQQQIVNSSATGAPTIGGTAQVGETLTVDTSDIADDDGLNNVTYGHQWIANDGSSYTDIADATESTYTLLAADEGKTIKVRVSFTDDAGDGESLTSTATATVTARPNTPAAGALIISGTAEVGETLSADTSGIVDTDGLNNVSFSYQWIRNDGNSDTDITSETESTYILVADDEGKTIKVRVSFTDDEGNDESLTSTATAAVVAEDPQPQEPPAKPTGLTGTVSHDAVSLSWDNPGDESVTGYQILRLDKALHAVGVFLVHVHDTGSASPSYFDEDVAPGARYEYRIRARNAAGLSEQSEPVDADTPAEQADTTAPTISSIAITSDPDAGDAREEDDGVYGIGDAIEVTVTFSENVTVTGTPRLELYIGGPGKTAAYESVVGSTVVFSYTVAERDWDNDGIAISSNRLTLNGGSIKDAADNDADLSHVALSAQEDHKVDGIPPRVSGFYTLTTNRYTFDGAYTIGDIIYVGVSWSGNGVSVTGNPQLTLDFNGTSKTSNYVDGWLGSFSEYTVEEGDSAPDDGVAIPANAISLNGGAIKDRAGNDAVLTHPAFAADTLYSTQYSLRIPVDGIRPTVTSVEIVSDPGDADTYGAGDVIKVLVTFSENIVTFVTWPEDVDGEVRPTIELNIGGEARIADYYSRSGTTVTFAYTVQSGDTDDDGISIEANKVWAGPVTPGLDLYLIRDLPSPGDWFAGNYAHDVSHDAIADDSGHKVDGPSSTLIISGESLVYHTENEEKRMGYYRVSGADGDITWSLSGDDSDDFSFTKTGTGTQGVFYFQSPPNYEDPTDSDADNEYRVTLNVSDGTNTKTWPVVVLVVNALFDADEVPVIVGEARVGETLTVDLSNITYDSTTMKMYYLWARIDGDTATRVGESTDSSYTLTADDVGKTVGLTLSVLARDFHLLVSEPTAVVSGSGSLNNPATGQPTISGTAQVGETLSAGTSGIVDTDGLNNVSFSYQWIRNDGNSDTDITSETESTYILVADDEGKTIKVRVTFTDDAGDGESLTSTATATVTARPNTPATGAPIISGTAQVGETLTADTSGIVDTDGLDSVSFSYQWLSSSDTDIAGATDATHILAASDEGKTIKVRVSFTDDAANEETLTSAATAEVVAAAPTEPAGRPRNLTGTANADGTVTLSWDAPNDDSVTGYQILRRRPREGESTLLVHVNDTGSTATEYTDNDVTHDVLHTYRVKAINAVGLSRQSNFVGVTPTLPAEPAQNSPATGAPTINGTAQVGQTLTVYTSGIADADGLSGATFSYQWIANDGTSDTDITGETDFTYILVAADEGKTIKVRVSFTDDAGNEETLTSAATVSVAARPNSPATGAPIIGGTVQVGETLTADTSGIADADGLSGATFSYQWVANDGGTDADISSETDATYTLVAADVGDTIKVKVTFTDDAGNEEALTSGATDAVAAADPPAEPTGLSATVVSHDTVTLTWDDPQDDSITGYVILRRDRAIHPTGTFVTITGDTGSTDTTYTDETVEPDKEYVYRIKAINDRGQVSEMSHWRRTDTPSIPVPDKPTGLSAAVSHDTVTLTWDDPQDDSITGYVILRRDRADPPGGDLRHHHRRHRLGGHHLHRRYGRAG